VVGLSSVSGENRCPQLGAAWRRCSQEPCSARLLSFLCSHWSPYGGWVFVIAAQMC
jgi:hypothetical protein